MHPMAVSHNNFLALMYVKEKNAKPSSVYNKSENAKKFPNKLYITACNMLVNAYSTTSTTIPIRLAIVGMSVNIPQNNNAQKIEKRHDVVDTSPQYNMQNM